MDEIQQPQQQGIKALSTGHMAAKLLQVERKAVVMGVTSRGIFLKFPSRWIVFISGEPYRGPLTVNAVEGISLLDSVRKGDTVCVSETGVIFPEADIILNVDRSEIWSAQSPLTGVTGEAERQDRLRIIAVELQKRGVAAGLKPSLAQLTDINIEEGENRQELDSFQQVIADVQANLGSGNMPLLVKSLAGILGAGQGLTPSGDDFILGMLLSWNRWRENLWSMGDLGDLNEKLVAKAYEKTTTLSANLIECAANGQADERLVRAIDYLMCGGVDDVRKIVDTLLGWGSSSGVAAFTGMAVAITTA